MRLRNLMLLGESLFNNNLETSLAFNNPMPLLFLYVVYGTLFHLNGELVLELYLP